MERINSIQLLFKVFIKLFKNVAKSLLNEYDCVSKFACLTKTTA